MRIQKSMKEKFESIINYLNKSRADSLYLSGTIFLALFVSIGFFRLKGQPLYRDWLSVPYDYSSLEFDFISRALPFSVYNSFRSIGLSPAAVESLQLIFWFTLGTVFSYLSLKKISDYFHKKYQINSPAEIYIILLSFFLTYNPWTFERLLMGQMNVLRGYFLFLPGAYILTIFIEKYWNQNNFDWKDYVLASIYALFVTFFSEHFGGFLFFFIIASIFWRYFVKLASLYQGKKTILESSGDHKKPEENIPENLLDQPKNSNSSNLPETFRNNPILKLFKPSEILKYVLVPVSIFLPSYLYLLQKFGESNHKAFFDNQILTNPEAKLKIIEAFSLDPNGGNLYLRALIGSASWDSSTFLELSSIRKDLGSLAFFSPYFNSLAAVFIIWVFAVVILLILKKFLTQGLYLQKDYFVWFLILFASLILLFGLSPTPWREINKLFYELPFSYTYREAGKFFAPALVSFTIAVLANWSWIKDLWQRIFILAVSLNLFGSLLLFGPLAQNFNYVDYPQIFDFVSDKCQPGEKVLYLPYQVYMVSSYSQVYHANPSTKIMNCDVLSPNYAAVKNSDTGQNLTFSQGQNDREILQIIAEYTTQTPSDEANRTFERNLDNLGVEYLLIDDYHYPELSVLNSRLRSYKHPLEQEDSLYLYQI